MNCKRIQELILTDYTDGQLSSWQTADVQDHLMVCVSCRMLAQDIKNGIQEPLSSIHQRIPDPFVWQRIKNQIQKNEEIELLEVKNVDLLKGLVPMLKPYFAGFMFFVLLGLSLMVKEHWAPRESYLSSLVSLDSQNSDEITGNIEKYFL